MIFEELYYVNGVVLD